MQKLSSIAAASLIVVLAACGSRPATVETAPQPMAGPGPIVASIDLTAVAGDRLHVVVDPGPLAESEVLFRLPRVVQGTYDISDFGSYAEDLRAYDAGGSVLQVERLDVNSWRIPGAARLDRVEYYVNDTFDQEQSSGEAPFSPSGTNIDPSIFVLNLHGFVGYFEGMTETPYEIRITAPTGMAKSSAPTIVAADTSADGRKVTDVYRPSRYFQVTDNPMMYGDLSIADFSVDDIDIELALYSPTHAHTVDDVDDAMHRMMAAQRAYLGDLETTDSYGVYVFLAGAGADAPTGFGALEHHTSTVVVLPEMLPAEELTDHMIDIVSHEFFHIVSPLGVHSEDVHDFDYYAPTFSKHLWMYEGQTEYFASHFQVYEGLESPEDFYGKMAGKIDDAAGYDDSMSFTEMSENIVDEPYATNYANVYQKGALIGMCLDVIMRDRSGGARSLMSLMKQLSDRYGVARAFDDETIIDEITGMTYPEMGEFLAVHVVDGVPIDYNDCLRPVGVEVASEDITVPLLFRSPDVPFIDANPATGEVFFRSIPLSSTLNAMGVEAGDVIKSVNGTEYSLANLGALVQASVALSPESEIRMVVDRGGEEIELSGPMGTPVVSQTVIRESGSPTPGQVATRRAWLNQ